LPANISIAILLVIGWLSPLGGSYPTASRPTWKGYLKLPLVSVPVKAFTVADSSHNHIQLNRFHEKCGNRIRYQKTCPEHGEVPSGEIISGYQVGKDRYVAIDPDELTAKRPVDRNRLIH